VIVQESIIFRYVLLGEVKERFFALNKVTDATGYGLYQQMKSTLEYSGLKVTKCIRIVGLHLLYTSSHHCIHLSC
jgi:hypothetical protein